MNHLGKGILILILIPVIISFTIVFIQQGKKWQFSFSQIVFLFGFLLYCGIHFLLPRLLLMHILGHEITHAFWARIFGGRMKSLYLSSRGGKVTVTKSNFLITLAPYFFPFYTLICLGIYFIVRPSLRNYLIFIIGFTLAFHFLSTISSLKDKQTDLERTGKFFSWLVIYWMNLILLTFLLSLIWPQTFSWVDFWKKGLFLLLKEGKWLINKLHYYAE